MQVWPGYDILELLKSLLQIIAWPSLVVAAWKLSRWLAKMEAKFVSAADILDRVATNHLPHLQKAVEDAARLEDEGHARIVDELKELRADIRAKQ